MVMKKFGLFVGIISLMAVACEKEANQALTPVMDVPEGYHLVTISAKQAYTKSTYSDSDNKTFSWSAHDKISVLFHKGSDNEFVDFETTGTGASVSFTGMVKDGYEIGSSDSPSVKYALFPASASHTFTEGELPVFYIPYETDYTTGENAHFSANLPMMAIGDGSNNFTFKHLTNAIKLTFKDLEVDKVLLQVSNESGYHLSGGSPIAPGKESGDYYLNYGSWGGGTARKISFVEEVNASNKATFYIPYLAYNDYFHPSLTLKNAENGYTIKSLSNENNFFDKVIEKGVTVSDALAEMIVLPEVSASGSGTPFVSSFGINWLSATSISACTTSGKDAIKCFKYSSNSSYVYIYAELDESKLYNNASYKHSHHWYLCLGDGSEDAVSTIWTNNADTKYEGWLKTNNSTVFDSWKSAGESITKSQYFNSVDGTLFYEARISRSVTFLQGTSAKVGLYLTSKYVDGESTWLGSDSEIIGVAPVDGGAMGSMTLATYVAP